MVLFINHFGLLKNNRFTDRALSESYADCIVNEITQLKTFHLNSIYVHISDESSKKNDIKSSFLASTSIRTAKCNRLF